MKRHRKHAPDRDFCQDTLDNLDNLWTDLDRSGHWSWRPRGGFFGQIFFDQKTSPRAPSRMSRSVQIRPEVVQVVQCVLTKVTVRRVFLGWKSPFFSRAWHCRVLKKHPRERVPPDPLYSARARLCGHDRSQTCRSARALLRGNHRSQPGRKIGRPRGLPANVKAELWPRSIDPQANTDAQRRRARMQDWTMHDAAVLQRGGLAGPAKRARHWRNCSVCATTWCTRGCVTRPSPRKRCWPRASACS